MVGQEVALSCRARHLHWLWLSLEPGEVRGPIWQRRSRPLAKMTSAWAASSFFRWPQVFWFSKSVWNDAILQGFWTTRDLRKFPQVSLASPTVSARYSLYGIRFRRASSLKLNRIKSRSRPGSLPPLSCVYPVPVALIFRQSELSCVCIPSETCLKFDCVWYQRSSSIINVLPHFFMHCVLLYILV